MRKRTKNRILKGITTISVMTLMIGACCLDGDNVIVPVVLMGASLAWIAIFTAANCE